MFIQTESTPNPNTMKFLPGMIVNPENPIGFTEAKQALNRSPLATALFHIEEVKGVFIGSDFITITKEETTSWEMLKPLVLTTIMEHLVSGKPALIDTTSAATPSSTEEEDADPIVQQIKEIIETRVRPAVAQDGGDIVFHGFEDGIVKLELHGSCSGCPSSTITLKSGIENMLKHYVPEVIAVEAV